jgi:hypothetical protein
MPVLVPLKPVTIREPQLLVENKLPPGRYRFQLVVIDDGRNESDPAQLVVTVRERPIRPIGPVIRPEVVDRIDRVGPVRPDITRIIRRPS